MIRFPRVIIYLHVVTYSFIIILMQGKFALFTGLYGIGFKFCESEKKKSFE